MKKAARGRIFVAPTAMKITSLRRAHSAIEALTFTWSQASTTASTPGGTYTFSSKFLSSLSIPKK